MPTSAEPEAWHDGEDSDDTIREPSDKWSEGRTKLTPPLKKKPLAVEIGEGDESPYKSEESVGPGLSFYHDGKKTTKFFPFSPERKARGKGQARVVIDERLMYEPDPPRLDSASREKAKAVEARILAKRLAQQAPHPQPHQAGPWLNTKPAKRTRIFKPSGAGRGPARDPPNGNCATLKPPQPPQPPQPLKPRALQRIMADRFERTPSPRPQTPPSSPRLLLIYEGEFYSPPDDLRTHLLTENLRSQAEALSSRSCSASSGRRSAFPGTPNPSARSASDPIPGNPFFGPSRLPSSGAASAPTARNANANANANVYATARTVETPTHHPQPLTARNLAALRAALSPQRPPIARPAPLRSLSGPFGVAFVPYCAQESSGPLSPATFGHRVFTFPINATRQEILAVSQSPSVAIPSEARGPFYFTEDEREALGAVVESNLGDCPGRHRNCTACIDTEYAYNELRVMPATMSLEERGRIINDNRSLRNIKNELENLLESGTISDEVYDTIMRSLPTETPLNSAAPRSNAAPASVPINSFNGMRISEPPPPAYNNPTPPTLPSRQPSQPPAKPEIARAVALYRYTEPEDCTFQVGDTLSVQDYMNAEWWFGTNLRTGKEGVFPVNYVKVQSTSPQDSYNDEKASGSGSYGQAVAPAPGPSSPYDSSVPPMGVANQPVGPTSKGQENAKKFGKKLGNAAVFGAGATLGGKLVNSIF